MRVLCWKVSNTICLANITELQLIFMKGNAICITDTILEPCLFAFVKVVIGFHRCILELSSVDHVIKCVVYTN